MQGQQNIKIFLIKKNFDGFVIYFNLENFYLLSRRRNRI